MNKWNPIKHIKLGHTQCVINAMIKQQKNEGVLIKQLTQSFCLNNRSMNKRTPKKHSKLANTYCLIYSLVKPLKKPSW